MNNQPDPTYRHSLKEIYKLLIDKSTGGKLRDDEKGIHAGLWLDKYIDGQAKEDTTSRRTLVEQVSLIPIPETYRRFYKRWKKTLHDDYDAKFRYAEVRGRMAVGLGNEGVLETSVALHRTYGVPYIPGSALKGLAAHYANLRASENSRWKKDGDLYNVVFGTAEGEGNILFFDALYVPDTGHNGRPLHPDVIAVHHREYYQDPKKAPADWDSPTPIPFLSATGTYLIALAAPELPQADDWINGVFAILEGALAEMGIGAKTSSGYGRMAWRSSDKDETNSQEKPQTEPIPYMRPNIPNFVVGQSITGLVVAPTDELHRKAPEAKAYLRFRDFHLKQVLMIVESEEAANWTPGQTRNCSFLREEEREGCTVLICQPVQSKFGNKKKRS